MIPGLEAYLSVDLAPDRGLRLPHPVIVAAGGAGFGSELLDSVGDTLPGAIVTRSVTRRGRPNPAPRMTFVPGALLSSVGPHSGLDDVLRRHAARWAASDVPVIVSVCAEEVGDITALVTALDLQPGIAGIELNLACPDRSRGGLPVGLDVEATEAAVVTARAATGLPLVVKLTPLAADARLIARAAAAAGADAICAVDALPGLALDEDRSGPALGTTYGGISGPALKPVALRIVYEIAQVVRIPIIGVGGVSDLDDVLDFMAAGATAVGLATAALADPSLPGRLGSQLGAWCRERGLAGHGDLIGTALPRRRDPGSLRRGPYRP